MHKIAFFDTKPYDKEWFDRLNPGYEIVYFESKLRARSARLAEGCEAVCAFVNDTVDAETVNELYRLGYGCWRCAVPATTMWTARPPTAS